MHRRKSSQFPLAAFLAFRTGSVSILIAIDDMRHLQLRKRKYVNSKKSPAVFGAPCGQHTRLLLTYRQLLQKNNIPKANRHF